METKHNRFFSIVRTTAEEDGTPFDATEVYVYRDMGIDIRLTLEMLLEGIGFECLDAYPDEGTESPNGHISSYWARYDGDGE